LAGPFFYNLTDRVFFQGLGEKNKKQKFVTRNQGDPMGSAALALSSACGPYAPVPIDGAI
jgi:hypothetical protein